MKLTAWFHEKTHNSQAQPWLPTITAHTTRGSPSRRCHLWRERTNKAEESTATRTRKHAAQTTRTPLMRHKIFSRCRRSSGSHLNENIPHPTPSHPTPPARPRPAEQAKNTKQQAKSKKKTAWLSTAKLETCEAGSAARKNRAWSSGRRARFVFFRGLLNPFGTSPLYSLEHYSR